MAEAALPEDHHARKNVRKHFSEQGNTFGFKPRFVRANDAYPILILMPQLYGLKYLRAGNHFCAPLVERIADTLPTVDFGPAFAKGCEKVNHVRRSLGFF